MLTPDVLNLLAVVLSRQSVSLADPNYDEVAALYGKARRQLLAAIEAATENASEDK